ncbi:hypothetical protein BG015_000323 [Linnemannia schmuckeri]|uniref:Smr domain-containing protein n=1 Tax=Linnemannia schmuckeri TaxID=64567 RepID=A0A9P5S7R7_9FUNG|nr:hypothetical protein BG015_000323 [Linnemannia schmuckeri]
MDPQEKLEAMFCPRLDSALVASIYHDMKDFKACIPILSALAADMPRGGAGTPSTGLSTTAAISATYQINGRKQASAPINKNKKSNQAPSTDKNILIWSEEVANSNTPTVAANTTSSSARSGLFKFNKQGQVTNSSSFRQPTTLVNSPATSATQAQPVKASYKATRNPRYMQKHAAVVETLEDTEEDHDQEVPEEDNANDDEQDATLGDAQETFAEDETASAGGPGPKKKKNRRQKRHGKTGKGESLPPSLGATPQRGTWRKEANAGLLGTGGGSDDESNSNNSQKSGDSNEAEEDEDEEGDSVVVPENATRRSINGLKAEELEFLKSCFPDREYSDEYLAQVLKDCRRDLEAAVEMILSQMFLENEQVETSSSGSGSFHSSLTTSSTTTNSLDDAFYEGVQNGKSSRKKWKTTGSGGSGSTTSDGVAAWGAARHQPVWDGQNDPLLKTVDRQEDFLIPESNEWATFDHQISILMNIFHTVPKRTIVSDYHANGAHLFKTVESIEARLKQDSRNGSLAAQGRERQTQFDINLAQLMEMFPEHSAVGLKKMLVYNSGNVQDAMNAVLAADFARADMNDRPITTNGGASMRGNVIPFQADIRYANKNEAPKPTSSGNRLKSLPSTSNPFPGGPRPFPNTIVENANADLYNDDDDPIWCRQRAHEILEQRNELFRKAAKAYQATKGKGAGMGGIAAYYADEGKKLDVQGKQWHMRAARAVVQQHRLDNNDPNLVDLHGLTVSEAQTVVREAVTQWFSRATMQASRIAAKPLKIICGVGSHSKDRIARLYPTILNLLQKDGWRCEAEGGVILVKGVSRIMPSKK